MRKPGFASLVIAFAILVTMAYVVIQVWRWQPGPPTWYGHLIILGTMVVILNIGVIVDYLIRKPELSKVERKKKKDPIVLSPMFTVLWVVWTVLVLLYEILTPRPEGPIEMATASGMWTIFLMAFLVFEITALIRDEKGDTLSEVVSVLLQKKPEHGVLAMGFAWLLLIRLVEIGQPVQISLAWLGSANFGRLLLAIGIGSWLTLHWAAAGWRKIRQNP